ncbi:ABC transporter related protein [Kribbella flavida DSM 17836]|uniref:ABC transporter related protein n=1 Tax=Kribbella flavida (strain DSM 17836 / JCM 10339 / NBRC 14399) TaxID=479435 RepID=D2Q2R2_KRIFD|nr:ABC transporter ATP-binding protein [Kribbella flavida]ADB30243.1 ABC transporter related protein [Kribbella flavida DSM 17836]
MEVALTGVTVEVAGRALVDRLELTAVAGEVVGVVGPNGSGKSTALRCVYRALRPTAGAVLLDGADLAGIGLRESARHIAAMTQDQQTDLDFTVTEIVQLGRTPHLRGNRALGRSDLEICRAAMEQTGVDRLADRSVLTLSGGERQRVALARALAQQPSVLVLDEPTNHLDLRHQAELLRLLQTTELTVLVALHDLNLAAAVCDRLAVLDNGRIVAVGTPDTVLTPELLRDVFGVAMTVVAHPTTGVPQLLHDLAPTISEAHS